MARFVGVLATRERLAFGLAAAVWGVAAFVVLVPDVAGPAGPEMRWERLQVATSALAIAFALALRRWPGIVAVVLILAVEPLGQAIATPGYAWAHVDELGNATSNAQPAFGFLFLSVLARMTVPATILALYATSPERRLARWVPPVAWSIVLLTVVAAALRWAAEVGAAANQPASWTWQQSAASQLDNPGIVWIIAFLAVLGSLRAAALRHVGPPPVGPRAPGPSRAMLAAAGLAAALWIPATMAFVSRPHVLDSPGDGSDRWVWLPILLVLVGVVSSRWSRFAAWAAIAGAFQAEAALTFYRGIADVVVLALAGGPDVPTPITYSFVLLAAASVLIQAFSFGAFALATIAVWRVGATTAAVEARWALMGAVAGIAICTWYIVGAALISGFPFTIEVLLVPSYPFLGALVALALWRRLVPAVAEAEAVATRPLRPLRYLEVVVSETVSSGAEYRRRAVEAERARLASTLHAEFLPNLERLASENAAGASREEVSERLRELQDEVRRLMAERRLVVLEEFGIVEALEWLVAQAEERVSFAIDLTVDDASMLDRPPRDVERAAFRIAQLAVENAIQHAGPSRLTLHVLARPDRLTLSVTDDGRWLAPSPADRRRDHVGIADMRSEADNVRAAVEVTPSQGGGTTVQFAWPAVAHAPGRSIAPAPGSAG